MAVRLNAKRKQVTSITYGSVDPILSDPADWSVYGTGFLGHDDQNTGHEKDGWSFPVGNGTELSMPMVYAAARQARVEGLHDIADEADRLLAEHGYLALNENGDQAELLVYGNIGGWDEESVHASTVVRDLTAFGGSEIHVRINSFGGSVTDGLAIFNALQRHSAHVVTHIDGIAASIASMIAAAGNRVEASTSSCVMIHAPWTIALGNAKELRQSVAALETFEKAMASAYAPRLGKKIINGMLTDGEEHWFSPDEAMASGLVDTLVSGATSAASTLVVAMAKKCYGGEERVALKIAASGHKPKEDRTMPDRTKVTPAPGTDDNVVAIEAAAKAKVLKALTERNALAAKTIAPFLDNQAIRAKYEAFIIDPSADVSCFQNDVLAELGRDTAPVGNGHVSAGGDDEVDKFRSGASHALLARAGLEVDDPKNEYRGSSTLDIARAALTIRNVPIRGFDKMTIVATAFTHTTGDFPLLLADVAHKSVLKGWAEQEETFTTWTTTGTLPDFKPMNRVDLNLFPSLLEVPEGAEYKYATIGEHGETVQLATYGRLFSITRKAIINDDLNQFSRIPQRMGRASKRTIGNLVYAILTGNPNLSDGIALFASAHNNLLTAAAISTDSVDVARVAMQTQKDPDGFTTLNLRPKFFLVPAALEGTAKTVMASAVQVPVTGRNYTVPNSVANLAEVISEARLDAASATAWYMVSNPSSTDTIEVDYLDGQSTPHLEQQQGWEVDGVAFKVRIDAGVKALDFRGIVRNPGA